MSAPASARLTELRKQLDATPWLKWALLAIAALCALFVGQGLESLRLDAQKRAIDAEANLRRIHALQGQEEWLERAAESEARLKALHAQLPPAATPGMAQAALQSWLNELIAAAGEVQNPRISVDDAVALEIPAGVLRVHGSISGGMPARQALNIVRKLESATNLVSIETIDLRNEGNRAFSVTVNAYYRLSAATTEASE